MESIIIIAIIFCKKNKKECFNDDVKENVFKFLLL